MVPLKPIAMPILTHITIYPIKSFDGHALTECKVLPSSALAGDRRFALVNEVGKFIRGKNCPAIHTILANYSPDLQSVTLSNTDSSESFSLEDQHKELAAWCSEVLGLNCRLVENKEAGMPDDTDSPGPTIISTATLETVANWFEGIDLEEARRRFRFNLEISDVPPFWEDGLVANEEPARRFRLGDLHWQGGGICQRCVVPTRNSFDSTVTDGFVRQFRTLRAETLPDWAPTDRFDHFYRLGVNTRIDSCENTGVLRVGDSITVQ